MTIPHRIQELQAGAWRAQSDGRFLDAAVLQEQAYYIARGHGMRAFAFHLGQRASMCWAIAGRLDRKLALLLEVLQNPPADVQPEEIFHARGSLYEFFVYQRPNLEQALRALDELERMALTNPTLPHADIPYLRSELYELQGRYAEALELLEISWMADSPLGYSRYQWALYATRLNLRMNRRAAAEHWCAILGVANIEEASSRAYWHLMRGHLALWDQDLREVTGRSMDAEDAAAGLQSPRIEQGVQELRIRALLLDPSRGDPDSPDHPARQLMARRRLHRIEHDTVFDWRLLRIDYRLACVRHAVGMAPVDDLWYSRPQRVPALIRPEPCADLQRRALQTRRAAAYARRYAELLDGCLQSDYRRREVRVRMERLDEILRAVDER